MTTVTPTIVAIEYVPRTTPTWRACARLAAEMGRRGVTHYRVEPLADGGVIGSYERAGHLVRTRVASSGRKAWTWCRTCEAASGTSAPTDQRPDVAPAAGSAAAGVSDSRGGAR